MKKSEADKILLDFCRAAWKLRTQMSDKSATEDLLSSIFTAIEMARALGRTEEEYIEIVMLTRPPDPDEPSA
jgi:hypothetical protein